MSAIFDGSTDALRATISGIAYPFSIAMWQKPTGVAATVSAAAFARSDSDTNFAWVDNNAAQFRGFFRFAGVDSLPGVAGLSAGAWQSSIITATSATRKDVFLAGSLTANDTTNTGAIPAFDQFYIGADFRLSSGLERFFNGKIAYVSVHNAALSASDALAHAAGTYPTLLPGCTHLFKLNGDILDSVGAWSMTDLGTITFDAADNPPVVLPTTEVTGIVTPIVWPIMKNIVNPINVRVD